MKMKKTIRFKRGEQGIVNFLVVIFIALLATLLIALIQSRLLLSIYRNRSVADILIDSYDAESATNDILLRLVTPGYDHTITSPQTLPDGTVLNITYDFDSNPQTFTLSAQRPFAVYKIEAERTTAAVSSVDRIEIILVLDVTGSMDECADPSGSGNPCTTGPTRFTAAKTAALSLVDTIAALADRERIYLGAAVFETDANWMRSNYSVPDDPSLHITPTNDWVSNRVYDAINLSIGAKASLTKARQIVFGNTSIGSGFTFAQDYYSSNPPPVGVTTKRVEVIITDGEPTARKPDARCDPTHYTNDMCPDSCSFCGGGNTYNWQCYPSPCVNYQCRPQGRDYIRCTLADTGTQWTSETEAGHPTYFGIRDPSIIPYVVTIFAGVPNSVKTIFNTYTLPNGKYYDTPNANDLSQRLDEILGEVTSGAASTITIRRVVP